MGLGELTIREQARAMCTELILASAANGWLLHCGDEKVQPLWFMWECMDSLNVLFDVARVGHIDAIECAELLWVCGCRKQILARATDLESPGAAEELLAEIGEKYKSLKHGSWFPQFL